MDSKCWQICEESLCIANGNANGTVTTENSMEVPPKTEIQYGGQEYGTEAKPPPAMLPSHMGVSLNNIYSLLKQRKMVQAFALPTPTWET